MSGRDGFASARVPAQRVDGLKASLRQFAHRWPRPVCPDPQSHPTDCSWKESLTEEPNIPVLQQSESRRKKGEDNYVPMETAVSARWSGDGDGAGRTVRFGSRSPGSSADDSDHTDQFLHARHHGLRLPG